MSKPLDGKVALVAGATRAERAAGSPWNWERPGRRCT